MTNEGVNEVISDHMSDQGASTRASDSDTELVQNLTTPCPTQEERGLGSSGGTHWCCLSRRTAACRAAVRAEHTGAPS